MESRDAMGLPPPSGTSGMMVGSGSLGAMLQRSMSAAAAGGSPQTAIPPSPTTASTGLHSPAAIRPGSGPLVTAVAPNTSNVSPSPYPSDISTALVPLPITVNMSVGMGTARTEPVKRKRGRPRKYGPDGSMALALAPLSTPTTPVTPSQKRGRGRPPGSGRKQQLAALGGWVAGSAGVGFTPHVITIAAGEDVATKIMSFSQQGPRAICILSANGAISNVTLRQPATSGGTVTYEGRFEILSLSGSFLLAETGGTRSRTGGLSVSLAGPDGRVVGGGVAGLLMAASPVQVVVGSFLSNGKKSQPRPTVPQTPGGAAQGVPLMAVPVARTTVNETFANKPDGVTPLMGVSVAHASVNDTFATKPDSPSMKQGSGIAPNSNNQQHQIQNMGTLFQSAGWPTSQAIPESRHTDINISLPGG